jgi:hypothetical protein
MTMVLTTSLNSLLVKLLQYRLSFLIVKVTQFVLLGSIPFSKGLRTLIPPFVRAMIERGPPGSTLNLNLQ